MRKQLSDKNAVNRRKTETTDIPGIEMFKLQ